MVATASIAAALRCLIDALMLLALGEREDWTKWRRIRVSPKVPDIAGESVRPSNKRFLVPRRVCCPNGISVCQSVHPILQGARSQTTQTTERRDMRRNSPHPAMWRHGYLIISCHSTGSDMLHRLRHRHRSTMFARWC